MTNLFLRERTPVPIILYASYLVFEGLSLRAASRALGPSCIGATCPYGGGFRAWRCWSGCSVLDGCAASSWTRRWSGSEGRKEWVWVAYEPYRRGSSASGSAGRGAISPLRPSLGGSWSGTGGTGSTPMEEYGYPEACRSLGLEHRPLDDAYKSIVERAVQVVKDRTESFDDYFPCKRRGCHLEHVRNWLNLFSLHQQPDYLKLIDRAKEVISLR